MLVRGDFSQIELRVLAELAGDDQPLGEVSPNQEGLGGSGFVELCMRVIRLCIRTHTDRHCDYTCVYIYVYIYIYTYLYIHIICTCMSIYIYVEIDMDIDIDIDIDMHMYMWRLHGLESQVALTTKTITFVGLLVFDTGLYIRNPQQLWFW